MERPKIERVVEFPNSTYAVRAMLPSTGNSYTNKHLVVVGFSYADQAALAVASYDNRYLVTVHLRNKESL